MNENDIQIRKQWLIMWIISSLIGLSTTLLEMLNEHRSAFIAIISLLSIGAFSMITYHCIYKKPGTQLVTFLILFTISNFVITPILYLKGKIQPPAYIPYYGAYVVLTQLTGLAWIVVCWRMRKTNKRLKQLSGSGIGG